MDEIAGPVKQKKKRTPAQARFRKFKKAAFGKNSGFKNAQAEQARWLAKVRSKPGYYARHKVPEGGFLEPGRSGYVSRKRFVPHRFIEEWHDGQVGLEPVSHRRGGAKRGISDRMRAHLAKIRRPRRTVAEWKAIFKGVKAYQKILRQEGIRTKKLPTQADIERLKTLPPEQAAAANLRLQKYLVGFQRRYKTGNLGMLRKAPKAEKAERLAKWREQQLSGAPKAEKVERLAKWREQQLSGAHDTVRARMRNIATRSAERKKAVAAIAAEHLKPHTFESPEARRGFVYGE